MFRVRIYVIKEKKRVTKVGAEKNSRWDTHGHPLADFNGNDPQSELFIGTETCLLNFLLTSLIRIFA